ncbi:class I adenylate-forming enzyme family protein [Streptomyces endophyticus]|uniref:AMP-binding protein n=1 Tax=Streptomyces endophyticus TaxID=714166 RepID=A0ABU6FEG3_9ACTN|nr:AMP-binding protein [Streptomyces endophyticus]MEB8342318.1 AMP-binding protein [Streptomyces endophyticus]
MQSWIHVLEWRATTRPDVPALIDDRGTRLTYAELLAAVERRAGGWARAGVAPGDVVAVIARNSADFFVHSFALMRVGAIPALVNWRLSKGELRGVFELLQPVAVAADAEFAAPHHLPLRIRIGGGPLPEGWRDGDSLDAPPPARPVERLRGDAVMALVHSSGTTGRPKAVPLRHGALVTSVAAFALEIGDQVAGARHLQLMPLFHLGGLGQALQVFLTAGTLVIPTAFRPAAAIDTVERERIQFFTAGPSIVDMLVAEVRRRDRAPDLSSLVEIAYGSAPITPTSLQAALATFGCRFRQIYGNTESQSMISLLAPEDHQPDNPRLATAGRVSFGWEVAIVGPDGRPVATDTPGELLIRGDCLFNGYWNAPETTAEAFTDGGWYRTGDIARLDADRYLTILDRATDMIITGEENVYPAEVEAVLARHPDVAEAAVVGRPDARWGEAVHAVVVPAEGRTPTAEDLVAFTREHLAHFKCPRSVEFTAELPRTTTGKVLKRELRSRRTTQPS